MKKNYHRVDKEDRRLKLYQHPKYKEARQKMLNFFKGPRDRMTLSLLIKSSEEARDIVKEMGDFVQFQLDDQNTDFRAEKLLTMVEYLEELQNEMMNQHWLEYTKAMSNETGSLPRITGNVVRLFYRNANERQHFIFQDPDGTIVPLTAIPGPNETDDERLSAASIDATTALYKQVLEMKEKNAMMKGPESVRSRSSRGGFKIPMETDTPSPRQQKSTLENVANKQTPAIPPKYQPVQPATPQQKTIQKALTSTNPASAQIDIVKDAAANDQAQQSQISQISAETNVPTAVVQEQMDTIITPKFNPPEKKQLPSQSTISSSPTSSTQPIPTQPTNPTQATKPDSDIPENAFTTSYFAGAKQVIGTEVDQWRMSWDDMSKRGNLGVLIWYICFLRAILSVSPAPEQEQYKRLIQTIGLATNAAYKVNQQPDLNGVLGEAGINILNETLRLLGREAPGQQGPLDLSQRNQSTYAPQQSSITNVDTPTITVPQLSQVADNIAQQSLSLQENLNRTIGALDDRARTNMESLAEFQKGIVTGFREIMEQVGSNFAESIARIDAKNADLKIKEEELAKLRAQMNDEMAKQLTGLTTTFGNSLVPFENAINNIAVEFDKRMANTITKFLEQMAQEAGRLIPTPMDASSISTPAPPPVINSSEIASAMAPYQAEMRSLITSQQSALIDSFNTQLRAERDAVLLQYTKTHDTFNTQQSKTFTEMFNMFKEWLIAYSSQQASTAIPAPAPTLALPDPAIVTAQEALNRRMDEMLAQLTNSGATSHSIDKSIKEIKAQITTLKTESYDAVIDRMAALEKKVQEQITRAFAPRAVSIIREEESINANKELTAKIQELTTNLKARSPFTNVEIEEIKRKMKLTDEMASTFKDMSKALVGVDFSKLLKQLVESPAKMEAIIKLQGEQIHGYTDRLSRTWNYFDSLCSSLDLLRQKLANVLAAPNPLQPQQTDALANITSALERMGTAVTNIRRNNDLPQQTDQTRSQNDHLLTQLVEISRDIRTEIASTRGMFLNEEENKHEEALEEMRTCQICMVPYSEDGTMEPMILNCHHVACKECLKKIKQNQPRDRRNNPNHDLICPICRTMTPDREIRPSIFHKKIRNVRVTPEVFGNKPPANVPSNVGIRSSAIHDVDLNPLLKKIDEIKNPPDFSTITDKIDDVKYPLLRIEKQIPTPRDIVSPILSKLDTIAANINVPQPAPFDMTPLLVSLQDIKYILARQRGALDDEIVGRLEDLVVRVNTLNGTVQNLSTNNPTPPIPPNRPPLVDEAIPPDDDPSDDDEQYLSADEDDQATAQVRINRPRQNNDGADDGADTGVSVRRRGIKKKKEVKTINGKKKVVEVPLPKLQLHGDLIPKYLVHLCFMHAVDLSLKNHRHALANALPGYKYVGDILTSASYDKDFLNGIGPYALIDHAGEEFERIRAASNEGNIFRNIYSVMNNARLNGLRHDFEDRIIFSPSLKRSWSSNNAANAYMRAINNVLSNKQYSYLELINTLGCHSVTEQADAMAHLNSLKDMIDIFDVSTTANPISYEMGDLMESRLAMAHINVADYKANYYAKLTDDKLMNDEGDKLLDYFRLFFIDDVQRERIVGNYQAYMQNRMSKFNEMLNIYDPTKNIHENVITRILGEIFTEDKIPTNLFDYIDPASIVDFVANPKKYFMKLTMAAQDKLNSVNIDPEYYESVRTVYNILSQIQSSPSASTKIAQIIASDLNQLVLRNTVFSSGITWRDMKKISTFQGINSFYNLNIQNARLNYLVPPNETTPNMYLLDTPLRHHQEAVALIPADIASNTPRILGSIPRAALPHFKLFEIQNQIRNMDKAKYYNEIRKLLGRGAVAIKDKGLIIKGQSNEGKAFNMVYTRGWDIINSVNRHKYVGTQIQNDPYLCAEFYNNLATRYAITAPAGVYQEDVGRLFDMGISLNENQPASDFADLIRFHRNLENVLGYTTASKISSTLYYKSLADLLNQAGKSMSSAEYAVMWKQLSRKIRFHNVAENVNFLRVQKSLMRSNNTENMVLDETYNVNIKELNNQVIDFMLQHDYIKYIQNKNFLAQLEKSHKNENYGEKLINVIQGVTKKFVDYFGDETELFDKAVIIQNLLKFLRNGSAGPSKNIQNKTQYYEIMREYYTLQLKLCVQIKNFVEYVVNYNVAAKNNQLLSMSNIDDYSRQLLQATMQALNINTDLPAHELYLDLAKNMKKLLVCARRFRSSKPIDDAIKMINDGNYESLNANTLFAIQFLMIHSGDESIIGKIHNDISAIAAHMRVIFNPVALSYLIIPSSYESFLHTAAIDGNSAKLFREHNNRIMLPSFGTTNSVSTFSSSSTDTKNWFKQPTYIYLAI